MPCPLALENDLGSGFRLMMNNLLLPLGGGLGGGFPLGGGQEGVGGGWGDQKTTSSKSSLIEAYVWARMQ